VANFIVAQTSDLSLGAHANTGANGARPVADLHAVEIKTLAAVAKELSVASMTVKGLHNTRELDQVAIVP
jgi:hypothetical protein